VQFRRGDPAVVHDQIRPAQARRAFDAEQQIEASAAGRAVDQHRMRPEPGGGRAQRGRGGED
jgi:hypothetical protein